VNAADARYGFARGVRLKSADDDSQMLLVPEGIVRLSETAAASLELVDGKRDARAIAELLGERFDEEPGAIERDVRTLLDELVARGFLTREP
jgi:pyrroloquinoline quinone biosynthesis protein D